MNNYKCNKCLREFKKKSHLEDHLYKRKKDCEQIEDKTAENRTNLPTHPQKTAQKFGKMSNLLSIHNDISSKNIMPNFLNKTICNYCLKEFIRKDSLKRHIDFFCKIKKNKDENSIKDNKINKLIEDVNILKALCYKNGVSSVEPTITNKSISNSKADVKVLNINGFGKEIIKNIDVIEAINIFLRSTGGNIIPNMFKYINMNKKYPENYNICITDFAREIVKINDGKRCIFKKFKTAKYEIISCVSNNINCIIDIYKEGNYKKNQEINDKIEINSMSLRLINGEELIEDYSDNDEEYDNNNNDNDNDNKSKKQDELKVETKEEIEQSIQKMIDEREKKRNSNQYIKKRLNIEHFNAKREGLQKLTFEKLKEELYNCKHIVNDKN
jgi:hypothetical protein